MPGRQIEQKTHSLHSHGIWWENDNKQESQTNKIIMNVIQVIKQTGKCNKRVSEGGRYFISWVLEQVKKKIAILGCGTG